MFLKWEGRKGGRGGDGGEVREALGMGFSAVREMVRPLKRMNALGVQEWFARARRGS